MKLFKIFCITLIIFFTNTHKTLSIESKIVLKIDNNIITNTDIENEANYLQALNPNLKNLDRDKIFQIAKNSLVREQIKKIEISKLKKKNVDKKYLDSVIKSIYLNIGIENKNEFLIYIKNFNIDINDIERKLTQEALWNQIIFKKFFSKVKIDKNNIKKEIVLNKQTSSSYLLSEILINVDNKNKIDELLEEIKTSINSNGFENTALIYSISDSSRSGGKLGWINEASMSKKILNQITSLKVGELTKPILIPGGFLILKIDDKKKIEKKIDIETEISKVIREKQNVQLNQFSTMYFNKIMKDVKINEQ